MCRFDILKAWVSNPSEGKTIIFWYICIYIKVAFFQLHLVGLGFTYIGLESKNGNNFEWPSGNMLESNLLDNWNPGQPDNIEVGSCVVIRDRTWYDGTARYCGYAYINFICESR